MAILIVRVPETETLLMNEFFDYDGVCYGLTRSRYSSGDECLNPEDFYEGTVQTEVLENIPAFFAVPKEDKWEIAGWYKRARVFRKVQRPSVFLEGNVAADARDAYLLPEKAKRPEISCQFDDRYYEVIEDFDARYDGLKKLLETGDGKNAMIRYAGADVMLPPEVRRNAVNCHETCTALAENLMSDKCRDISDVKTLAVCADLLTRLDSRSADGYYYLAMACHQAGQVKKGMKAAEKALKLEPAAGDLLAMKGNLLISMGCYPQAASVYHEAWLADGDEDYLILEGRAWMFEGRMDAAYQVLKQVENKQALYNAGINLKDMEHKWPFINVRGFSFKNLFGRNRNS